MWARLRCAALAFGTALVLLGGSTAQAQHPSTLPPTIQQVVQPVSAAPSPPAPAPAPSAAPTADDARHLLDTLQNDDQRAALIRQLQTLAAADHKLAPAAAPAPTGAEMIFDNLTSHLRQLGTELASAESAVIDTPNLWGWFSDGLNDPDTRALWIAVGEKLSIILGAAIAADGLVRAGFARLRRYLLGHRPRKWYRRFGILLFNMILDVLPPLAFAGVALLVLPYVNARALTRGVTTIAVDAVMMSRLLIIGLRTLLVVPGKMSWRLLPLETTTARELFGWLRTVIFVTVYGFSLSAAAALLDVPDAVCETLNKLVALILAVIGIAFVVKYRQKVATGLRPKPLPAHAADASGDIEAGETETGLTPRHPAIDGLRYRVADLWHVLAIIYIVGVFLVYALRIEGGFAFLVRATLLSVAIVIGARVIVRGIQQIATTGFSLSPHIVRRFPTLETRTNRYVPVLSVLLVLIVRILAIVCLFQVWGVSAFGWFTTTLGQKLTSRLTDLGIILVTAFVIWEVINATIDRYLEGVDLDGNRIARSARIRTLLPLFRNAALVILLVVTGLLIFPELGINVAPLLAGAGVVGLAVGFGSQALVKDVITGMFVVIEDTLAVGDLVELGGRSGIVEALSIRTVKLRDVEGALYTIPFGEISTVKNRSKEFSQVVIAITLAHGADVERATAIMQSVADDLKQDSTVGSLMLQSIVLGGISKFDSEGIQISGRIKVLPLKNGDVGAEYYKRLIPAFEAAGITLPSPQYTVNFGAGVSEVLQHLRPMPIEVAPPAAANSAAQ